MSDENKTLILEQNVNRVAKAIRKLRDHALEIHTPLTKEGATKISNYLRHLVETLAQDLDRKSDLPPGEFSLDADIPSAVPPIPPRPMPRTPEPEGRLVGQRKTTTAVVDEDGVGFIQE